MNYDIIIIGAGTSTGFLLSFLNESGFAKEQKILVLDKNKEPFRKIYSSGNGRCNFSNTEMAESAYYSLSGSDAWKKAAFAAVSNLGLKKYFFSNGIPSYNDEFGRLMPYTNSAKTIGAYFEKNLKTPDIAYKNYSEVLDISANGKGFAVKFKKNIETTNANAGIVVFACGGSAYPQLGTDGSAFNILKKLKHTATKQIPGIVPLETKENAYHALSGLKMECEITYNSFKRKGEILFTKYGISGPNVLYASNEISLGLLNGPVKISLDFLPEENFTLEYFQTLYSKVKEKTIPGVFGGVLNGDFLKVFAAQNNFKSVITLTELENVYRNLKNVVLTVNRTRPFKEAQVSLGGIPCEEIDPVNFESKLHKNLFIMGEALDYTGICGGYNIHWCAATAKGVSKALAGNEEQKL